jgi:hypothetical protein
VSPRCEQGERDVFTLVGRDRNAVVFDGDARTRREGTQPRSEWCIHGKFVSFDAAWRHGA